MNETLEEYVARINAMSNDEIDALIAEGKCPYESERDTNKSIGMFHCPLCGEMLLAGVPHI